MVLEKPRVIYQLHVERRSHIRRFFWNLLGIVAAFGAAVALYVAEGRGIADPVLLQFGQIIGLGVSAMLLVRAVFALVRGLRRRNEYARFYDRGFTWQRGKEEHKYSWSQVKSFREGVRQLRLGRLVLGQVGAQTLTTRDGQVYKFTQIHGDPKRFASTIRPFLADVMGEKMARALREKKSVRLHPKLVVMPAGIQAGKHKIRWSDLDVAVRRGRLIIRQADKSGKFRTVQSFGLHEVDNVGGFMEIATSTIKNYQPERFNIKTQKPTYA
jgi:hypothetical protein